MSTTQFLSHLVNDSLFIRITLRYKLFQTRPTARAIFTCMYTILPTNKIESGGTGILRATRANIFFLSRWTMKFTMPRPYVINAKIQISYIKMQNINQISIIHRVNQQLETYHNGIQSTSLDYSYTLCGVPIY